jgi:hypothetical protein
MPRDIAIIFVSMNDSDRGLTSSDQIGFDDSVTVEGLRDTLAASFGVPATSNFQFYKEYAELQLQLQLDVAFRGRITGWGRPEAYRDRVVHSVAALTAAAAIQR